MFPELIAYLILPLYTILFAADSNWFTANFSVIGNQIGQEKLFVLWGLIVGLYFFVCLHRIVRRMEKPLRGARLIPAALLLHILSITTPYLPETLPRQSRLHVIFAFFSAVCLVAALFLIIWRLRQRDRKTFSPFIAGMAAITYGSLFLLVLAGIISSALEIFFTISTGILVCRLYRRVIG